MSLLAGARDSVEGALDDADVSGGGAWDGTEAEDMVVGRKDDEGRRRWSVWCVEAKALRALKRSAGV